MNILAEASVGMPDMDYGAALIKMVLSLSFCIALLVLSVWFLKRLMRARFERGGKSQQIQVIEKKMISPKSAIYLVEIEGKRVVLSESQLEVRRIHSFPDFSPLEESVKEPGNESSTPL